MCYNVYINIIINKVEGGGLLFRKLSIKLKIIGSNILSWYYALSKFIKTNTLAHRLFWLMFLCGLIILAGAMGQHHKNKDEYIKAMTVSDIDQSLSFSKTGTNFKLYPQKRNKDMTIVPFKLGDTENQSTHAEDYKVTLMPIMRESLQKNISTSVVFFGSSGEGAIAIKGDLPKEPVAIVLTNHSNFATEDAEAGEGKITIAGEETKVDYNGVGFTINAKAKNVKKDKLINQDMSMSDLYFSVFAKKQLDDISANFEKSKKKEKQLENKKSSLIKDVKKANKALDKDENDVSLDNSVDSADTDESDGSSMDETIKDTDTSNTDIENKRNELINNLEDIKGNIKSEQDYQEGLKNQSKEVTNYTKNKVFDLLSIHSDTQLRNNDDVKK